MWYRKNVGGWERAARLIGGGLMLICGVVALHASPLGLLLSGAGVVTLVTGVFGYCPACAIAGREQRLAQPRATDHFDRHGVIRGIQRGTAARNASYSFPNVCSSVGSSYATTATWKTSHHSAP